MTMIDIHNLSSVLSKKLGVKLCSGLNGKKCMRPRRDKGWLCADCHRIYMKDFMAKKRGTKSEVLGAYSNGNQVVDGYDFNQEIV